jgi:hypothetical protein
MQPELPRELCESPAEHGEHTWMPAQSVWRTCPGLREIPLIKRGEPYPHAQCGRPGCAGPHPWTAGEAWRWCRGDDSTPQRDRSETFDLAVKAEPRALAGMIDRDCTPDFKISLVRCLLELDPALRAEIFLNIE